MCFGQTSVLGRVDLAGKSLIKKWGFSRVYGVAFAPFLADVSDQTGLTVRSTA